MSKRWIRNRLRRVVSYEHHNAIRKAQYLGDIQSHLFNLKKDGHIIVNQLDYNLRRWADKCKIFRGD